MSYVCCLFSPLPRKVAGTPVLPSPQKPPFRNSNSSRNHQLEEEPLLLIILFIYIAYAAPLHFFPPFTI